MDEASWADHWRQLYAHLDVLVPVLRDRALPGDAHLDRLEARLGCRLPASYRAFVRVIGPGYLARSYVILAPGYRGASVVDFVANNKWQETLAELTPNPDQTRRLVAFGQWGNEYFAWDIADIRMPAGPEYRIFHCPRDPDDPLRPVADSFPEFIEDACLGGGHWRSLGGAWQDTWEDEEGQVRSIRCFEPIGDRPRSPT